MSESYDYLFKFLVIGSAGTGKSCLLHQFIESKFKEDSSHTIGVEFGSKVVPVSGKQVKLQIWDTAGQERFKSVTRSYYRGAAGALLVYDVTRRDSFNALANWLADARSLASPNIVVLLVGNKSDLESQREVTFLEASRFAQENELMFLETSAKSGQNVVEAFSKCAKAIVTKIESGELDPDRIGSDSEAKGHALIAEARLNFEHQTMADSEAKGHALIAEARAKLQKPSGLLSFFFGGSSKVEDAVECYQRAGNMFKMAKKWNEAGKAFCEAASLHAKADSKHDAATNYAIEIYTDMGRFTMAARHHQSIAEIYETEAPDLEAATSHYEKAADYFRGEESNSSANKCILKVAQHAAQLADYEKAISIYEQVAATSLESSLLKYSAKEYFFRAGLCHLCVDMLNAQLALDRYIQQYPAFQDAREYKLLKVLMEHMEEQNVDGFTEAVKDYDSVSRFDQWYTTILLRIKKSVQDNPDLC
ncbi:Hypothetical predicted protein [Cloeon dipterum]|uniref:Uncharacterized protein n=1 Tax=Cloeon dipterum TaxID=197152 RepID=A0A8S1BR87_9INSE|nr:Hypothetical predicted protein [Cloeon dipterum]